MFPLPSHPPMPLGIRYSSNVKRKNCHGPKGIASSAMPPRNDVAFFAFRTNNRWFCHWSVLLKSHTGDSPLTLQRNLSLFPGIFKQQNNLIKAGAADAGIRLFRGSIRGLIKKGNMRGETPFGFTYVKPGGYSR